jgi:hypothetical protein
VHHHTDWASGHGQLGSLSYPSPPAPLGYCDCIYVRACHSSSLCCSHLCCGNPCPLTLLACTERRSVNFWRSPEWGARRNADILFAFTTFFVHLFGVLSCQNPTPMLALYALAAIMWIVAVWLWIANSRYWLLFHVLFHTVGVSSSAILYVALEQVGISM